MHKILMGQERQKEESAASHLGWSSLTWAGREAEEDPVDSPGRLQNGQPEVQ